MKNLARFLLLAMLVATLGLFGCDGDDGDDGKDGAPGVSSYQAAVDAGIIPVDPDTGLPTISEEEWYEGLTISVGDALAPLFPAEESCNVCHHPDSRFGLDINSNHPPVAEKPNVEITDITRAGDILTVNVYAWVPGEDDQGNPIEVPVTGVGIDPPSSGSDFRVYMADIVPLVPNGQGSNTVVTGNAPVSEWWTSYPERWATDRASDAGVVLTEPTPGNYVFQMVTPITQIGGTNAPEGDLTHLQRVYVRVDPRDFGELNRSIAVADFTIPADAGATGPVSGTTRTIVVMEACTACHGDPLQRAAHGGGYQSPQVCVMCHSPIGGTPEFAEDATIPDSNIGNEMQASGFWLASLIHNIHGAHQLELAPLPGWIQDNPDRANYGERVPQDFSEITYPQFIQDCTVCHFDDGQDLADNWKTNPTIQACTTCHDVNFATGEGHGANNIGGPQNNGSCQLCHPADTGGVGGAVAQVHAVTYDKDDLLYDVNISISPDDDGTPDVYETGDVITVTVTTTYPDFPYTSTDTNFLRSASLYVYGPRSLPVPVLTPGSTTDPEFVDVISFENPLEPPDQGRSMLISAQADDPNVLTDADGFGYLLLEVTEDMAAGTYMMQTNIDFSAIGDRANDGRHIGPRLYPLDGWQLINFQVKTATEEPKTAGECTACHNQSNFSTMAHRSYFGTDGCNACHDQSGNHADPLTNRVHAVHAASTPGDLTNVPGAEPTRVWDEITFPRDLNQSCDACHNSGDNHYRVEPYGTWGYACIGCHAGTEGARQHMIQGGSPFPQRVLQEQEE